MKFFNRLFNSTEQKNEGSHLFSPEWFNQWKDAINESEDYRKQAAGWNQPLILMFKPVPEFFNQKNSVGIYLDLQSGKCTDLRYAEPGDLETDSMVLSATEEIWLELLESNKNPSMYLLKGSLSLKKGSKTVLLSHAGSAKALLDAAPKVSPGTVPHQTKQTKESSLNNGRELAHKQFKSVTTGLNHESFPMKLFQKAKVQGIWNPSDISFKKDREDWIRLKEDEQTIINHLCSLFLAGEEAVTLDLLPLIRVIAREGRLEEEIYLTSFLWEEAKHTEFFSLFVKEVMYRKPASEEFHGPFYKKLFYEKLPAALSALDYDSSPEAQLKASATYNMIVEGTLAETGYEAWYKMLEENNLLPGLREGVLKLKQDESRHIAYGLWLINRLLEENPDLKPAFESTIEELLTDATNIIHEIFERYDVIPFGLEKEWFLDYSIKQFQYRMQKLKLNN